MHQSEIILVVKQWQIRTWCTNIACYCVRYQGLLLPEKYYHFKGSNKPDIQNSESALFVLLYSLCLHTKLCQGFEVRNDAKPKLPAMKSHHISPNLASTCMHSRTMTLLASKGLDGNVRLVASSCLQLIVVKVMFNCGTLLVKIMFKCGILTFISQDLTNRIVE